MARLSTQLKGIPLNDLWTALLTPAIAGAIGIALLAGLIRGFAGFGSGVMMAPVRALLYGPAEAVSIIILLEVIVSFQLLKGTGGLIQWRFVAPMGAAACLFMPLGVWILKSAAPALMTRAMGLVVLGFVLILLIGWRHTGGKKVPIAAAVGAISGTMMAATSMGIPPVLLYMLSGPDPAAVSRANIIAYFSTTQLTLALILWWMGLVHPITLGRAALMFPAFALCAWAGSRLFRAEYETLYRRIAMGFLVIVGVAGIMG